ncbi:cation:proton antiporter [Oceaniglobus roseus]|uniref:cation:proton antiporter domain-containing protein n=1 Tax=Oceaniglobus roseus TaxID=1737570 RepID=UPI000C7F33A6|nr:cation:proton antiporter [Kandeliimicrobium roseum]
MESFLYQASIYLAAAVIAVPLAARLGLGSVLGYLAAGIIIGPALHLVGSETADLQHFAEFGVVMMLFVIGLELEPKALWAMRHRLIGLGGLQVLVTMALVTLGAVLLGVPLSQGVAVGMIFALSSTAIVLQTLTEKGLMQTAGGRSSFSVLLTQDIAVIPMLALLPLLAVPGLNDGIAFDSHGAPVATEAAAETTRTAPDATHGATADATHGAAAPEALDTPAKVAEQVGETTQAITSGAPQKAAEAAVTLVQSLPGWAITLVTIGAVALIVVFGAYATRPIFRFIHAARLRELYVALALLIVISIAFVMTVVGLSPALGTFLAGVVLANSEFRHQLEADIDPFKGLLLGLFFITVGAGISFTTLFAAPFVLLGLTLAVMVTKGVVLYLLALMFKLKGRDRWLFTLGLAQAGEFGFVLVSFSLSTSVLPAALAEQILLVVALSMLLTPLFFILYQKLSDRIAEANETPAEDEIDDVQPIIIAGIGRFGQVINRMLQMAGFKTTVLDHNLQTIQVMRKFGFKGFFGDPTRPELLHAAGIETAKVLVVALDDKQASLKLVKYTRAIRPDIHIVARAFDRVHVYELYAAGADDIVREMFDSSLRAGRYVLEQMGIPEYEANEMQHEFFKLDRRAMLELAELWVPGKPVEENEAYVARARELNKDLETALVERMEEKRKRTGTDD